MRYGSRHELALLPGEDGSPALDEQTERVREYRRGCKTVISSRFEGQRGRLGTDPSEAGFSPEDFGIGRLFKHVRDAIIIANARSERIVLWNECAEQMFGYTEPEALALPLHALVPETLRDIHRTGIARYQETGGGNLIERGSPVELMGLHKEGHEIPIELTLTQVPERTEGGDRFVLAIIRDISERKKAEIATLKLKEVEGDRRRALELNDTIVQGLVVAKLAFENGKHEMGLQSVTDTLRRAQKLVGGLLGQIEATEGPLKAGDLVIEGDPDGAPSTPPEG